MISSLCVQLSSVFKKRSQIRFQIEISIVCDAHIYT